MLFAVRWWCSKGNVRIRYKIKWLDYYVFVVFGDMITLMLINKGWRDLRVTHIQIASPLIHQTQINSCILPPDLLFFCMCASNWSSLRSISVNVFVHFFLWPPLLKNTFSPSPMVFFSEFAMEIASIHICLHLYTTCIFVLLDNKHNQLIIIALGLIIYICTGFLF